VAESDLRGITETVACHPERWPSFREDVRASFDGSAARYESRLGPDHLDPVRAAIGTVAPPRRALDVGCGTGVVTDLLTEAFPSASICGVDLSLRMLTVAAGKRRRLPVRFVVGDAATLPIADGSVDLLVSLAVPVFASETTRVLTPGGVVIAAFPLGEATPIFLPHEELEALFAASGLGRIEHGRAGRGTFTIARKPR